MLAIPDRPSHILLFVIHTEKVLNGQMGADFSKSYDNIVDISTAQFWKVRSAKSKSTGDRFFFGESTGSKSSNTFLQNPNKRPTFNLVRPAFKNSAKFSTHISFKSLHSKIIQN
jgi:hypothetical protein